MAAQNAMAGLLESAVELLDKTIKDEDAPLSLRLKAAALVIQAAITDETTPRPPVDHRHAHVHITKETDHV